jgi:hypothetical protein
MQGDRGQVDHGRGDEASDHVQAASAPASATAGWRPLTVEEATRQLIERGAADDDFRRILKPWFDQMSNTDFRAWQEFVAGARRTWRLAQLPRLVADGYTDEEIVEELGPMSRRDARQVSDSAAALRGTAHVSTRKSAVGSRGGLTRDAIVKAAVSYRRGGGGWPPTQAAVAEELGLSDARRLRQLQGPRGWKGILADAQARLVRSGSH